MNNTLQTRTDLKFWLIVSALTGPASEQSFINIQFIGFEIIKGGAKKKWISYFSFSAYVFILLSVIVIFHSPNHNVRRSISKFEGQFIS